MSIWIWDVKKIFRYENRVKQHSHFDLQNETVKIISPENLTWFVISTTERNEMSWMGWSPDWSTLPPDLNSRQDCMRAERKQVGSLKQTNQDINI